MALDANFRPKTMKRTPAQVAAALLGSIGGKSGTGKAKARTSAQARAAVAARWAKRKSRLAEKKKGGKIRT